MSNENLSAKSWTTAEFEKLVELVKPHEFLHKVQDPSRKNILDRESTWELIASELAKPVEDCKKHWRALRDGFMRHVKQGDNWNKPKMGVFKKLDFLIDAEVPEGKEDEETDMELLATTRDDGAEQVITDNQEYYEITVVENPQEDRGQMPKLIIPQLNSDEPPKKIGRKNCGRKKYMPAPVGLTPIKILPKPLVMDGGKIIQYVNEQPQSKAVTQNQPKTASKPQSKSEVLDCLIEKILKEHTNEIDVFFRSMAASVKKLQPNLIPKVKMEVCNVIAKYEMQSFDKNTNCI